MKFANVAGIAILVLAGTSCTQRMEYAKLPDAKEVTEASLELTGLQIGQKDVTGTLRPEVIQRLLQAIVPATRKRTNPPRELLGTIRMKLENGETREIRFFDCGQRPLEFNIDNIPYVRSGEFTRFNRFSGEYKAFFPNEGIDLFNFLRQSVDESVHP